MGVGLAQEAMLETNDLGRQGDSATKLHPGTLLSQLNATGQL